MIGINDISLYTQKADTTHMCTSTYAHVQMDAHVLKIIPLVFSVDCGELLVGIQHLLLHCSHFQLLPSQALAGVRTTP